MPDYLASTVRLRTQLSDGFLAAAAPEAMTVYLEDWERAKKRLDGYIEHLRKARDERQAEKDRGDWPANYVRPAEPDQQTKVPDLMAALEASLARAKADRVTDSTTAVTGTSVQRPHGSVRPEPVT